MAVAVAFWVQQSRIKRLTAERDKYRSNTETLLQDVRTYKTKDSLNVAKVGNLELKLSEYKKYRADDAALIKSLQTKNRDLQRVTTAQMETINELRANVRDSIVYLPGAKVNVDVIDGWHKERGFKKQPQSGRICGYHFAVLPDGTIETGRFLSEIGAHVSGQNSRSIGICYVGGLDANGKAADTRTPEQKEALIWLLSRLVVMFPDATIKGHRDYSPDLNGDGIIEPWEYIKECPCFNAAIEYSNI